MEKIIAYFLFIALIFNCEESTVEDCAAVSCIANTSEAYFILLDSEGNNVLNTGIYTSDQITIKDSENENVNFLIKELLNAKVLELQGTNWDTGTFAYQLNIDEDITFTASILLEKTESTGCCSNTLFVENIEISGITNSFDSKTKISTITIP